jgi:hypothetical protein
MYLTTTCCLQPLQKLSGLLHPALALSCCSRCCCCCGCCATAAAAATAALHLPPLLRVVLVLAQLPLLLPLLLLLSSLLLLVLLPSLLLRLTLIPVEPQPCQVSLHLLLTLTRGASRVSVLNPAKSHDQ